MSTGIPMSCAHCGRPIGNAAVWLGQFVYHEECTRGPAWTQQQYLHPSYCGPREFTNPAPALTERDVRRIVREELKRSTS